MPGKAADEPKLLSNDTRPAGSFGNTDPWQNLSEDSGAGAAACDRARSGLCPRSPKGNPPSGELFSQPDSRWESSAPLAWQMSALLVEVVTRPRSHQDPPSVLQIALLNAIKSFAVLFADSPPEPNRETTGAASCERLRGRGADGGGAGDGRLAGGGGCALPGVVVGGLRGLGEEAGAGAVPRAPAQRERSPAAGAAICGRGVGRRQLALDGCLQPCT
jgi:hypothetical protein